MEKNKVTKVKEPVRIRFKKLANGSKSIYLDIYKDGVRNYEFLKLYIVPERSALDKVNNANNLAAAAAIKSQRIIDINNGKSGLNLQTSKSKMALVDFMNIFVEKKKKNKFQLQDYQL